MEEGDKKMEEGKKKETKKKGGCFIGIIVCIVLIVGLDIIAGFVALQAQAAQQDVKHNRVGQVDCKAPSKTAFVLGIIAVSCLAAAHVSANVIGCSISNLFKLCVVPKIKITTCINAIWLIFNWVVGITGAAPLAIGIWSNRESRSGCEFTDDKHFLSFGGIVCFVHAIFSIAYYVSSIVAKKCWC